MVLCINTSLGMGKGKIGEHRPQQAAAITSALQPQGEADRHHYWKSQLAY